MKMIIFHLITPNLTTLNTPSNFYYCYYYSKKVEYQSYPSMQWQAAQFELCVIQQLLETQFEQYITRVKAPTCQAELRRLLQAGPPIYISDKVALPLADEEHDTHVCKLWYAIDQKEHSAKLVGAPVEGVERDTLWAELNEFIIEEGKEEGDDDDDNDAKKKE